MRRIAIVGGGQAGFPLAFGLLEQGFAVTMVTRRSADEVAAGRVMSSQCMFGAALQVERDLRLNLWDGQCPKVEGIGLTVSTLIDWRARLDAPARSVDQRIKMPAFMALFEQRGGTLLIEDVGPAQLERLAQEYELVIVAAGKDDVVRLFERDAARSPFDRPMRSLAMAYVTGMAPQRDYSRVAFNLVPGVGEYFTIPALSIHGPCEIMLLEGIPGGPFDCFQDACSPGEHLARIRALLDEYLPWEAERARHAELTDANAILAGRLTPTVRKPVATLPSGKPVFGLGDAVCVNDPITGQGSNNATKAAKVYLDAIVAHGEQAYTRAWMEQTFARFWEYGQHVANWTNSLLTPPPPHVLALLGAAGHSPPLASAIANGFDHPPSLFPWWADETQHYLTTEGG
jgi:hypothetical protein